MISDLHFFCNTAQTTVHSTLNKCLKLCYHWFHISAMLFFNDFHLNAIVKYYVSSGSLPIVKYITACAKFEQKYRRARRRSCLFVNKAKRKEKVANISIRYCSFQMRLNCFWNFPILCSSVLLAENVTQKNEGNLNCLELGTKKPSYTLCQ